MADERELLLGIKADGSQAKQELADVAAAEAKVGQAAADVAAASTEASAQIVESSSAQREATEAVAQRLEAAKLAMSDYVDVAIKGGTKAAEALAEAGIATANLEIAIRAAQAAGAPVTPAALATLTGYDAALEKTTLSLEEGAAAARQDAAANLEDAEATKIAAAAKAEASAQLKTMNLEATAARGNVGSLARVFASLGGPVGQLGLQFLLVGAAVKLIPQLLKGVETAGTSLGNVISNLTGGLVEEDKASEKANEQLAKLDQQHKAAADSAATQSVAEWALNAGLIAAASSTRILATEELAREGALHGQINTTKEFTEGVKAMGITLTANLSDTSAKLTTFMSLYKTYFEKEGPAAAENFAKSNKAFLQQMVEDANEAGVHIPAALQAIIDKLGLTSKAYAENQKAIDGHKTKLAELNLSLDEHKAHLAESVKVINDHANVQIAASDKEYAAVKKSLNDQMVALNKEHSDHLISDGEFQREFQAIETAEILARNAHDAQVAAISAKANERIQHDTTEFNISADNTKKKIAEQKDDISNLDLVKERMVQGDIARRATTEKITDDTIAQLEQHRVQVNSLADSYALVHSKASLFDDTMSGIKTTLSDMAGGILPKLIDQFVSLAGAIGQIDVKGPTSGGGGGGGTSDTNAAPAGSGSNSSGGAF